jgi:hypothetical protein
VIRRKTATESERICVQTFKALIFYSLTPHIVTTYRVMSPEVFSIDHICHITARNVAAYLGNSSVSPHGITTRWRFVCVKEICSDYQTAVAELHKQKSAIRQIAVCSFLGSYLQIYVQPLIGL